MEEVECDIPGCAPIETLVGFYSEGASQVSTRVVKMGPMAGVGVCAGGAGAAPWAHNTTATTGCSRRRRRRL